MEEMNKVLKQRIHGVGGGTLGKASGVFTY